MMNSKLSALKCIVILSSGLVWQASAEDSCTVEFEEVTVVKQVPTYKKHCTVVEDTKCKTVFKNAIETTLETQCEPVFETKCDPVVEIAYENQCKMITDKECRIVHVEHMGEHQEKTICTDIPKEKCVPVPVKIPGEKCVNVPAQSCKNVPVTSPVEVPKEECWKKPRKVCQTLVTLKPKVVTEQIPKEVCEHSSPAEKQDHPFPFMGKEKKSESPFMEAFQPVQNPEEISAQSLAIINPVSVPRIESAKMIGPSNNQLSQLSQPQQPTRTEVITVKDVVSEANNRRNVLANKHKRNMKKLNNNNKSQTASLPPHPPVIITSQQQVNELTSSGQNNLNNMRPMLGGFQIGLPGLQAAANFANANGYIQEVTNPQQLISMPYQQIRKNQPTIGSRFGKPNSQNQQQQANDYDTMKKAHNAFLSSFPETDRFGVFPTQGTDRFGEFVGNDDDNFGEFEDNETDMFKRENNLGQSLPLNQPMQQPKVSEVAQPRSSSVQQTTNTNAKPINKQQIVQNSLVPINSLDEKSMYSDDLLGFYDGFEGDYYEQDYFVDQMNRRQRGEANNFLESVKSFATGFFNV